MRTRLFTLSVAVFLLSTLAYAQNDTVYYTERSWDSETKTVVETLRSLAPGQYSVLTSRNYEYELYSGYYVVRDTVTIAYIYTSGTVHIILCDSASLNFSANGPLRAYGSPGYSVPPQLYIHDQPGVAMGKLNMNVNECGGGIRCNGILEIQGGDISIDARRNPDGFAAIGCKSSEGSGTYRFFGGKIFARGGVNAAGIGGDNESTNFGTIEIYGGTIEAYGGDISGALVSPSAAGIGGGNSGTQGTVHIYGGNIKAVGSNNGAGIGSSEDISQDANNIQVIIDGGTVEARGHTYAAGIGGGDGVNGCTVTINGGDVFAYGGTDAAGIGGGEGADGGTCTITGGYVYAKGNDYGAGIGGGENGKGGNVTITGGKVVAMAGRSEDGFRAIGAGKGSSDNGCLTIADTMMVRDNNDQLVVAASRENACRLYKASVLTCTHPDATYTVSGCTEHDTHTKHCSYCMTTFMPELHSFVDGVCSVCGTHEAEPTGIEQITNDQSPITNTAKFLRNGVLYIVRNGKLYNAQGALIK